MMMISGRTLSFTVLIGLMISTIYLHFDWTSRRSATHHYLDISHLPKSTISGRTEENDGGLATILPRGVTALEACAILKEKYGIYTAIDLAESSRSVHHHWTMLHCPIVLLKISPSTVIEVAARNTSAASSTSSSNSETLKVSKNTDQNHSTEIGGADMHSVSGGQDTVATSSSTQATSSSSSVRPLKKIITNASKCKKMKATHGVIPGSSWGTLSIEKQSEWEKMDCDVEIHAGGDEEGEGNGGEEIVAVDAYLSPQPAEATASKTEDPQKNPNLSLRVRDDSGNDEVVTDLPVVSQKNTDWCFKMLAKYEVQPMRSWGKMPLAIIDVWSRKKCDLNITVKKMSARPLSMCPNSDAAVISRRFKSKAVKEGETRRTEYSSSSSDLDWKSSSKSSVPHSNLDSNLPLISIMAATTTRRVVGPSTSNLALFMYLLPSLVRSLDCGYRYEYVLGFDMGDPFYDSEQGMLSVKSWFQRYVQGPMRSNGISLSLRTVKLNNTLKKPGPVFLEMARAAYEGGATYFYRINDDTELVANWANVFVQALHALPFQSALGPLGVVGPTCTQGNSKILTHDFVHRQHMEVFEMNYYPPELTDWWMDDWISLVYGMTRTFKARKVTVVHHTGAHGQRYEVDKTHQNLLESLVQTGRLKIRHWMLKNAVPTAALKDFDSDIYKEGFMHLDVPSSAL